ncbi:aldolase/citrate lyase family protein [Nonomuraea sp. NBC_01738]|uniref:aldolase/citrate lyase family protein n=1 Tax=Nonomuraea sp. NBC_01738 TaxID=2976003 RepID=UPI002E0E0FD8|nr:aldolase/citrate lyase family protein [Nonomuraea sp. NBC_01738]
MMISYLYVPGNAPEKLAKAMGRGADALIVDLEDAVPYAEKDAAREGVAAWLAGLPTGPAGKGAVGAGPERVRVWVRVNPGVPGAGMSWRWGRGCGLSRGCAWRRPRAGASWMSWTRCSRGKSSGPGSCGGACG